MKIRAYLLIMIGAIILPISLFAAIALQTLLRSEREAALQALEETVGATVLLVDRELSSAEAALRVLAHSPHLAHGDMEAFYEHAGSADRGETGRTILFAPNGQQIINTVMPLGEPLPPPPDYVRVRTRQVIDTQRTVVSGLITGAVQRVPVTTINVPVPLGEGRRYVLASVFGTEYFSNLISQRTIPKSWSLAVIDRDGRFIARTRDLARIGQQANPELLRTASGKTRGLLRAKTIAGVDSYFAFTHSPMSGWLVAVSAPAAEIEGAARRAVTLAAVGMLVAMLCAAGAAVFFTRRLVASIRGAASAATALGHGAVPHAPPAAIAEVSELHRSIDEAAHKLAEAEAERTSLLEREQEARVVAEQQVQIRDEFLAMLSHELRNPLSGIVGAAQLLRMDPANPALKQHAQDILLRQGKHLTRIVDDLLDLARLARGKVQLDLRPVDLAAVVESTVDALRIAGKVEHQLSCTLAPAWVLADRTRIEQVVGNLVTNALKYTPKGGAIDISLSTDGDDACLAVRDSGVGIAPELMPQLFDIFVQGKVSLDRSQGGLGIGLSLVRSLVALHGGTIRADSEGTGRGSTFVLRLPLLDQHAPQEGTAQSAPGTKARPAGSSVLLIEDNHDARQMLAAQLAAMGYRVLEADNGKDGLELARRELPGLGIVDIGLPGMDGYQVAAQARRDPLLAGMRLIALTGYGQQTDRQRALDAGFDAHFVKPLKFEDLANCLAAG
ncbi:response regulator [Massilia sp. IC2-477]|uniref:hybrid sensor histidine kinase/response regulator n=1 Tax=Massilia sp. IC2-477 TaxID=2887198 RepID=UPI001D1295E3|nr:ATP-binding protein [Massilia sp. IC2-477]MCC2957794.1 response regulator [Massilia sp. IC2-477]